ncbi:hypothetical protein BGX38DRAFT_280564 [Terfezia claveryi]|nr:hypothetical protein BGX38DRAFT_280564 [Terfezia claveryi]
MSLFHHSDSTTRKHSTLVDSSSPFAISYIGIKTGAFMAPTSFTTDTGNRHMYLLFGLLSGGVCFGMGETLGASPKNISRFRRSWRVDLGLRSRFDAELGVVVGGDIEVSWVCHV